jgi:hypothetical protein
VPKLEEKNVDLQISRPNSSPPNCVRDAIYQNIRIAHSSPEFRWRFGSKYGNSIESKPSQRPMRIAQIDHRNKTEKYYSKNAN